MKAFAKVLTTGSFFVVPFAYASIEGAAPIAESKVEIKKIEPKENKASPWHVFGGIGSGHGLVSGQEYSGSVGGQQFLISGLVSYRSTSWVYDLGLSWIYSRVGGLSAASVPVEIQTRAGMIDLSPRYRLTERFQIGPALNVALGADTSYSSQVGASSSALFLGVKAAYEIAIDKYPIRLWSQLSTDVTILDRQVYLGLIGIQIGIPVGTAPKEKADVPVIPVVRRSVKIVLDPQQVFFSTNSSKLKPEVDRILKSASRYLEVNRGDWSTVEISGHADQRGRYEYNLALSQRRARSVREALTSAGVEATRLVSEGYSFEKPLDARNIKDAWNKNRRVEIVFNDIRDPDALIKILEPLTLQGPWDQRKKSERP